MIYALLIRLLSPLIVTLLLLEAVKRHGGQRFLKQRLGFGYPSLKTRPIWLHCASVGEVKAAEPLIRHFMQYQSILITTNTPTGAQLVQTLFADQVSHSYLPLDYPYAIKNFLRQTHPAALWVMETEIWPNLYHITFNQAIPITLVNARLSAKTLKAPKWLKHVYRLTLRYPKAILARCETEAQRFIALGAAPEKVKVIGNLKYAALFQLPNFARPTQRDYVLLASSHADEEFQIAQLWFKLKRPELLVIVPRHPKRSAEIQQKLLTLTSDLATYSRQQIIQNDTKIYIDDRIGQLMPWFSAAKLVIMGGAFVPAGGHNVLEPAALKAPIITGPDMSDFEPETQLLKANNAIVQCHDFEELSKTLDLLLEDSELRQQMGQNAWRAIQKQTHILADYVTALKQ